MNDIQSILFEVAKEIAKKIDDIMGEEDNTFLTTSRDKSKYIITAGKLGRYCQIVVPYKNSNNVGQINIKYSENPLVVHADKIESNELYNPDAIDTIVDRCIEIINEE